MASPALPCLFIRSDRSLFERYKEGCKHGKMLTPFSAFCPYILLSLTSQLLFFNYYRQLQLSDAAEYQEVAVVVAEVIGVAF